MIRRILAAALTVCLALVLLVAAWPQLFRLEWTFGIAQVVSLRGAAIAIGAICALVLLVVALLSARARRLAASLTLLFLVFCAVGLMVLSTRGFGGGAMSAATGDVGKRDLTVLSWNTLGDAPGAKAIARLALKSGADIVTLPETTTATGIEVARIMGEAGHPMWAFTNHFDEVSKSRSTTLLLSADLGTYSVDQSRGNTSVLPTVVATPDDGKGPIIVATHPVAPITGEMDHWRSDLTWLSGICSGKNVIMAGDFNSTLDHLGRLKATGDADFGSCYDAARAAGTGAVGTWPTSVPPLLGTPIDHVMTTSNWRVRSMHVVVDSDSAGSDHRPIVATITPSQ